jgi:2'-5' RNA ligase superfamily/Phage Mu protein F like protein
VLAVEKFNPYHDAAGRFTSAEGAGKPPLGTCYRDVYRAVHAGGTKDVPYKHFNDVKIVHGEVNTVNPITGEKGHGGHAWVEMQDGKLVHDVSGSGKMYYAPDYYKRADVSNTTKYSVEDADKEALRTGVYGPWGGQAKFIDDSGNKQLYDKVLKFKNCSTQVDVPEGLVDNSFIEEDDLAGKGREADPHVTVKYGVNPDLQTLQQVLYSVDPFEATLGLVVAFEPSEHSDGAAPIVIEVVSPELGRLHDLIGATIGCKADDFAYRPHLTLAYVKPEAVAKYQGRDDFKGKTFLVDQVTMTDTQGDGVQVGLGSTKKVRKADDDSIGPDEFADEVNEVVANEWLQLPQATRQQLLDAFTAGISKGLEDLMVSDTAVISAVNQVAQDFARDRAAEMVGMKYDVDGELVPNPDAKWAISDTTREQLNQIITDAFQDETSVQELADRIRDAAAFSDSRAAMIAHTETTNAMSGGNFRTWEQSGLVKSLRWLMSDNHTVEDDCDLNDDVVVPMGTPFPSGDYFPSIHPFCECAVVPAEIEGA